MDNKSKQAKSPQQIMHAYYLYPNVRFDTQRANEEVVLLLRAHPFTQIPWIFNTIVFLILLFLLNFILPTLIITPQILFLNIFLLAFIFSYAWINFLYWYFSVGVITNQRIIDIDFYNVIYREVTETRLSKVEDVTSKDAGFFGSLFNFGNVFVQTAGTEENIEFLDVPNPPGVVRIINDILPA